MVPMTLLSADLRYPCWDVPSRCCSDHLVLTPGGIDAGYFDNLLIYGSLRTIVFLRVQE